MTVIAAISLFALKEVIEFLKRRAERKRKITAYKELIMQELRKNAWTVASLKDMCQLIAEPDFVGMSYYKSSAGTERIRFNIKKLSESNTLWPVHTSVFEKVYVGLAETDKELFAAVSRVYEQLAEANHVRNHFINLSEDDEIKQFAKGLPSYGTARLEECEDAMDALCLQISGGPLSKIKLKAYV